MGFSQGSVAAGPFIGLGGIWTNFAIFPYYKGSAINKWRRGYSQTWLPILLQYLSLLLE